MLLHFGAQPGDSDRLLSRLFEMTFTDCYGYLVYVFDQVLKQSIHSIFFSTSNKQKLYSQWKNAFNAAYPDDRRSAVKFAKICLLSLNNGRSLIENYRCFFTDPWAKFLSKDNASFEAKLVEISQTYVGELDELRKKVQYELQTLLMKCVLFHVTDASLVSLINQESKHDRPILVNAILSSHDEVIALLAEKGAPLCGGYVGTSYLDLAIANGCNIQSIRLLLNAIDSIDVLYKEGSAPLHKAILCNRHDVVTLLLEKYPPLIVQLNEYNELPMAVALRTYCSAVDIEFLDRFSMRQLFQMSFNTGMNLATSHSDETNTVENDFQEEEGSSGEMSHTVLPTSAERFETRTPTLFRHDSHLKLTTLLPSFSRLNRVCARLFPGHYTKSQSTAHSPRSMSRSTSGSQLLEEQPANYSITAV